VYIPVSPSSPSSSSSFFIPLKLTQSPIPRCIAHLIEVKHQVQLAHIPKEAIQDLNEEVYCFQIRQFIVVRIYAGAEEEACIPPVDDLVVAELDEVRLVFLISGSDQAVDLFYSVSYRI
jgi:hypothetical protein